MSTEYSAVAVNFLREIGLTLVEVPSIPNASFLEDVRVVEGTLHYLASAKACNLLHEAGHVAIVPAKYRHLMNDDVEVGVKAMFQQMEIDHVMPGTPEFQAGLQVSEAEASAWSWAAGLAAGIPEELIIEDWCFEGEGALQRTRFLSNMHYGVNGLATAGFCRTRETDLRPGVVFPELNFWLQK
ncbi:hypothetical protein HNP46_000383 [Pseudomonas nitritireducens]|uniref:Uncharacterized protein n=1 Tax=Pseudomonas nitroreducens TaxID=46680 RepID=A0A7W7KEV3_PSENT|nr:hypothetical protein [Pseudomonas nitritireducens]MBB4861572.1 hypothetical protein [Pseudomonas nitritireducens]